MKTFKEWVKKRIREADAQSNPMDMQKGIAALVNQQPNPDANNPNALAAKIAQTFPNPLLASIAKTPKVKKLAALDTLNPKTPNQVITPNAPNQVSTPGLNAASNFN
jgi:hypothetical protein